MRSAASVTLGSQPASAAMIAKAGFWPATGAVGLGGTPA